jgi:uncharacterized protein involved in outer membrane biogenesis
LLGEVSGWPFLRDPLQRMLGHTAATEVRLEEPFHLRLLWQPRLEVGHLHVSGRGGMDVPALLDAKGVALHWRWRDFWEWRRGGSLRIHRLQADVLNAHVVRDRAGAASWQMGEAHPDAEDQWSVPRVGWLQVNNGHVFVDDAPSQTRLTIDLRGGEGEQPGQGGGYHMSVRGSYLALPLILNARSGAALPLLQSSAEDSPRGDVPLLIEGQAGAAFVRFDGHAGALLGDRRLRGSLHLRGPSLAKVAEPLGLTLPQTPPFDLKGELGYAAEVWHLRVERASIGGSRLDGEFRVHAGAHPPRLVGRLGGWRLRLADLGPAVGVPAEGKPSRGRVLPQRSFDLPSLHAMDADVQLAIDELDFGSPRLAPLQDLRTHLLLQGGVLRLQDLKAHVAGGRFSGATSLDANVHPARWSVDLQFGAVDVAGWIAALQAQAPVARPKDSAALKRQRHQARAGGEPPVRSYLTGTLGGAIKATGRGRSTAEILGSLDGRAQLMLREGTLSHLATEAMGLDVAEALGVLVRGDRPLPLNCAWIDFGLQQGVAQLQQGVVENDDTEVRIDGHANLRDESLALRMTARPKDFSPFTLRAPVTVRGTLAAPEVGVEGERLAGKVLGAVVLGAAINPLAALLPFVDLGVGDDGNSCARRPPAGVARPRPDAAR